MEPAKTKLSLICGLCDSLVLLFFGLLFLLYANGASNLFYQISDNMYSLFVWILPLTLLIFWRGFHDGERSILGTNWFGRAVTEGYAYGVLFSLLYWLVDYFAALFHRENLITFVGSLSSPSTWEIFVVLVLASITLTGTVGSMLATIFHIMNRFIVRTVSIA